MQFHSGVARTRETTATKSTSGLAEVAAILLHHYVRRDLGSTEDGVLGLIYSECLGNACVVSRIGIVPACLQFDKRQLIRSIAVDLVRGEGDKRGFGNCLSRGFQEIQRSDCVGIEVGEGNGCGQVVTGLRRGVNNRIWAHVLQNLQDFRAIANIELVMMEICDLAGQTLLIPAVVALGAEEGCALVVVDAMNLPPILGKV